ncbi:AraC family transcriptional regulator [Mycobacterium sp. SM1]|uniref:AraC family transcriptional regulator n=1 Tax=Mycobacterium sp. SM1 TaxID=2816243 RepID=UPI001BCB1D0E|nr:AraC family transcriptional regulator [Mycobacterium sp. SM1]MBS4726981.1 AraC family transcriptional regulator [Mycobacterium sp. SM1]
MSQIEHSVTTRDLIAELAARAPRAGANSGLWPGLTIYRFTKPQAPQWEEIQSLSLGIVAQGRKAVTVGGQRYVYDRSNYLVLGSNLLFQAEILEASPRKPFLSLVLQIDPSLVRKVSADMLERRVVALPSGRPGTNTGDPDTTCMVSTLDQELMSSVLRFLRSLAVGADRRVLAPLYVQEVVYRVLQREQFARMLRIAAQQTLANPIAAALSYIDEHLSEPLTVSHLAEQVSWSPSAFSHLFREVTGRSPYRFVKETRLDRARELLVAGQLGVTDVARAVGYASTSHFIKEFRSRFGTTPKDYANAQSLGQGLRAIRSDAS